MEKYKGKSADIIARNFVGDGKKPNLFFVSISSDFLYLHKEDDHICLDPINDIIPSFISSRSTIEVFKTYDEAKDLADEFFDTNQCDKTGKKFTVNCVTIEDRCCGQVYEKTKVFDPVNASIIIDELEDYHRFHKESA